MLKKYPIIALIVNILVVYIQHGTISSSDITHSIR